MRFLKWTFAFIFLTCSCFAEEETFNEQEIAQVEPPQEPLAFTLPLPSKSKEESIKIDLKQLYLGAPFIYTLLLILSITSLTIWLYQVLLIRYAEQMPDSSLDSLKERLAKQNFQEASHLCEEHKDSLFFKMIGSALPVRQHGTEFMCHVMTAEGKRQIAKFWQSVSFLNDIAVIAPLVGLLGTVLGLFYAFYDLHRSQESLSALFDGLSLSIGTTIAGIAVSVLSLGLYSHLKSKLVKCSTSIEEKAMKLCTSMEIKG